MEEQWKDIVSRDGIYVGRYQVSDRGRVRSHPDAKVKGSKPGRILFQSMDDRGYPQCELRAGNRCTVKVHRLVAEAFLGRRCAGMTVNHIDGNKMNNNLENLEYVTRAENLRHSYRQPHMRGKYVVRGEMMPMSEAVARFAAPGVTRKRVSSRVSRHGWPIELALVTPPGRAGRPTKAERAQRGKDQQ